MKSPMPVVFDAIPRPVAAGTGATMSLLAFAAACGVPLPRLPPYQAHARRQHGEPLTDADRARLDAAAAKRRRRNLHRLGSRSGGQLTLAHSGEPRQA